MFFRLVDRASVDWARIDPASVYWARATPLCVYWARGDDAVDAGWSSPSPVDAVCLLGGGG